MSYIEDCKKQKIYVITGDVETKLEVEDTNYYDHVIESVDKTTTPRGVGPRYFTQEEEVHFWAGDVIDRNEDNLDIEDFESKEEFEKAVLRKYVDNLSIHISDKGDISIDDFDYFESSDDYRYTYYVISSWGVGGNNYKNGKNEWSNCFSSEEEAEDALFKRVEDYDFQYDCNRDVEFFETKEEAESAVLERYAYDWNVDVDVAKSIISKRDKIDQAVVRKSLDKQKTMILIGEKEMALAREYANLIEPKVEKFKETMTRLSNELDEKLNKRLFIEAVKEVRSRINK